MDGEMPEANRFEVGETVRRLVVEILAVPEGKVVDSALLAEDLNASSMDLVSLALALDDEFNLEIDLTELTQDQISVGQIVGYVLARQADA